MTTKRLLFMLLATLLPLHVALAVVVSNLYQMTIPVPTQSDEVREQAVQAAFGQMLVKLSGDPHILKNPAIKADVRRADYYVQNFNYSAVTTDSSEYALQVNYDQTDVNRLLQSAKVSLWNDNRPLLLVWLAVSDADGHTATLIGSDSDNNLLNTIQDQSKRYGLPMILPLLDMTDLSQVSFDDVADQHVATLQAAAARYAPDGLLIGALQEDAQGINSQWTLLVNGQRWNWSLTEKVSDDDVTKKIIKGAFDQVSEALSHHLPTSTLLSDNSQALQSG